MVRRVVEEDVTTPSSTVVEDDGSWIGRTLVTLVVIALLVIGAVWLVNAVSDNDGDTGSDTNIELNQDGTEQQNQDDSNTGDGGTDDSTVPSPIPS